jgi:ferrochelatase
MKLGVALFQLGGPDSLESIEPFLHNLFCDLDIIDFPFARIARKPLASLISRRRAKHLAEHYAQIDGKSPILENTVRQATALDADLRKCFDAHVVIAMRYWRPFTAEAILQLEELAPDELVLLPLYPHTAGPPRAAAPTNGRGISVPTGGSRAFTRSNNFSRSW